MSCLLSSLHKSFLKEVEEFLLPKMSHNPIRAVRWLVEKRIKMVSDAAAEN